MNNLGHQGMLPVELAGPAYMLPHLLNRDAGGRPFEEVMIIGAGSGNDVAAALRQGAKHVDAVEIDPVINGSAACTTPTNPTRPRGSRSILTTAAASSARPRQTYDLISYAVVDSLAFTRATRASGWRVFCSPRKRSATSRRG